MTIQGTRAVPRPDLGAGFMEFNPLETNFIAPRVLPLLSVNDKSGNYSKVTREAFLTPQDLSRASSGGYARLDMFAEDASYACVEKGAEIPLPDDKRREYQSDFDAEMVATKLGWSQLMLNLEIAVSAAVFNTTTFTGSDLFTDYSSAPWATQTTNIVSQILGAIEKVRLNSGVEPNALIIGAGALPSLLTNDDIVARFPGVSAITKSMLETMLPNLVGLDQLIVGRQIKNSKLMGQTFAGDVVWSSTYAMVACLAPPDSDSIEPGLGRTALWTTDSPDLVTVEEYREEQTRSDIYRSRHWRAPVIHDAYFGHLLEIV